MYLSTFPQKGMYLYLSTFVVESTCTCNKYIQSTRARLWLGLWLSVGVLSNVDPNRYPNNNPNANRLRGRVVKGRGTP